tara:strand:+ start:1326 stop:1445 length:120 start_codon:yes stop_codon:yes gene_type:complete
MIKKIILLLYKIGNLFRLKKDEKKKEKEIEVPNERYTLW